MYFMLWDKGLARASFGWDFALSLDGKCVGFLRLVFHTLMYLDFGGYETGRKPPVRTYSEDPSFRLTRILVAPHTLQRPTSLTVFVHSFAIVSTLSLMPAGRSGVQPESHTFVYQTLQHFAAPFNLQIDVSPPEATIDRHNISSSPRVGFQDA